MSIASRQLDLELVRPSPWTGARLQAILRPRLSWRRVARGLCLTLALVSFAVMAVALRMALYGQMSVPSTVSVPITLGTAIAGILLLFGVYRLEPSAQ